MFEGCVKKCALMAYEYLTTSISGEEEKGPLFYAWIPTQLMLIIKKIIHHIFTEVQYPEDL